MCFMPCMFLLQRKCTWALVSWSWSLAFSFILLPSKFALPFCLGCHPVCQTGKGHISFKFDIWRTGELIWNDPIILHTCRLELPGRGYAHVSASFESKNRCSCQFHFYQTGRWPFRTKQKTKPSHRYNCQDSQLSKWKNFPNHECHPFRWHSPPPPNFVLYRTWTFMKPRKMFFSPFYFYLKSLGTLLSGGHPVPLNQSVFLFEECLCANTKVRSLLSFQQILNELVLSGYWYGILQPDRRCYP